jgi:microcystin-dependent protein
MTETTETTQLGDAFPTATGSVPIGTILPYCGPVSGSSLGILEDQGYLFCDGSAKSRHDYKDLFDVIGNAFGGGDNVNTFNLPNLQGLFLRGVSNGSGNDPDANSRTASAPGGSTGDNVGSYQACNYQTHTHDHIHSLYTQKNNSGSMNWAIPTVDSKGGTDGGWDRQTTGQEGNSGGGSETRPKNIYVNYIIKANNV